MKKLLSILVAVVMLTSFTACSRFGKNDNPPMRIPVADDRAQ